MALKTKIIVQQILNIDDTTTTASKYPKYTVVLGNSISSITAGELTAAVESSAASAAAAKDSEIAAKTSEINAKDSEIQAGIHADASEASATQAATSATEAERQASLSEGSADDSATSAEESKGFRDSAELAAQNAEQSRLLAEQAKKDAEAAKTAAATSEQSAAGSATEAGEYATTVKDSEIAAKTSELNAKDSEHESAISAEASEASASQSAISASQSAASATKAAESSAAAKTSETNAIESSAAAKTSETNAKTSETNAKTSETNAAAYAAAAKTSETNAAESAASASDSKGFRDEAETFATQASTSALAAKNSETNTKTSEINSKASEDAAKLAQQGASGSANTATQAVTTVQNLKSDVEQLKSDTQTIKDAAVRDVTALKDTAEGAATTATNKAAAAAGSATTAGQQATSASGFATRAETAAQKAEAAVATSLEKNQNLADLPDKAESRKNLALDRVSQFPTETLLRAPATATYFTVGGAAWGVYDSINATWKPLAIAQGGTGAKTVNEAKANLQLDRFVQSAGSTALTTPSKLTTLTLQDSLWGVYKTGTNESIPLGIYQGGTGAKTVEEARRNIGGDWEETQVFRKSEGIVLRRRASTESQWIAFYRETNNAAFRFGHETNDQLATHSYNTDGTYRKKLNQISANGDTSIFGSLSLDGNLTSAGEGVLKRISTHRNRFPQVNLWASDRTDVGAYLRIEIPSQVGSAPYFYQMVNNDDASNGVLSTLPRTTGVLAVQGTSGREYKKDISLADSSEALSRVTSLEMVNFVYKDDEKQRVRFGVIAEDAEKIAPQYVKHNQLPIPGTEIFDDEGNKIGEEYQDRPSIDVNPIVMDLLGCVQAQQKQIDELKELVKQLLAK